MSVGYGVSAEECPRPFVSSEVIPEVETVPVSLHLG